MILSKSGSPPRNPFVGPRPLTAKDGLYGRDRERDRLLDQLIADRIVLMYSPSGAGKTSLIEAGLIPALTADGFTVLSVPPARVGLEPPAGQSRATVNRYELSVLLSLESTRPPDHQRSADELSRSSLKAELAQRRSQSNIDQNLVLILDQFEELCTMDATDLAVKAEFMSRLGTVLRNPNTWALFAMREDYVAMLDPYLSSIPTGLSSTFRLDFLDARAARAAIVDPVLELGSGVTFSDHAAAKLVDDLRMVRVDRPGQAGPVLGPYVEPVQLQVVCRQLFDELPPGTTVITEGAVAAAGDIDTALSHYYESSIRAIVEETHVDERALRDWFDKVLITERGLRDQTSRGPTAGDKHIERALGMLIDAHIIRAERRRDVTWYELAHDRLIAPVQLSNRYWALETRGLAAYEAEGHSRRSRQSEAPAYAPAPPIPAVSAPQARSRRSGPWLAAAWISATSLAIVLVASTLAWPPTAHPVARIVSGGLSVWALSVFPGMLFVHFLGSRAGPLWDEFVLTLYRLGIDRPGNLPRPPLNSDHYAAWLADGGAEALGQSKNIYRQKYDTYYGRRAWQGSDNDSDRVSLEVLFPVLWCTALVTVGWTAALWNPRNLTHLHTPQTTFAVGFVCAYVVGLASLLSRYRESQLRPNAYAALVLRIGFMVAIVLAVHFLLTAAGASGATLAIPEVIMAAAAGLLPAAAGRAMRRAAWRVIPLIVPEIRPDYPLSHLDGLSSRYEARLVEQGVEDLPGLVTADLVDLLLHIRIPTSRLIYWVDQAVLLIHLPPPSRRSLVSERRGQRGDGLPTVTALRRVGVHTATDLLAVCARTAEAEPGADRLPPQLLATLNDMNVDARPIDALARLLSGESALRPVWNWKRAPIPGYPSVPGAAPAMIDLHGASQREVSPARPTR